MSCSHEDAKACLAADPLGISCLCGLDRRAEAIAPNEIAIPEPAVEPELVWPATTNHGADSTWGAGAPEVRWRLPRVPDPSGLKVGDKIPERSNALGSPEIWRTCWYCGCIHPEDLHRFLVDGVARLGGSDWKYGWPHKFYVKVVNPDPDRLWLVSSRSGGPCLKCLAEIWACHPYTSGGPQLPPTSEWPPADPGCEWCEGGGFNPNHVNENAFGAYPTLHGKFYNAHLEELEPPAFAALAPLILAHTGIEFAQENGRIAYRAPYRGYQR